MSADAVRLGVAGAGRVFERLYVPALERTRSVRVVALAEPDAGRREAAPGRDVRRYEGVAEMLDAGDIDGVAILTPARLHGEQVRAVLGRGLPVLVEKPAAMSTAEMEAWAQAGPLSLVTVGFSKRFWPFYERARSRAGPRSTLALSVEVGLAGWGAFAGPLPGPEHDVLPHLVDLSRWLTGEEIIAAEAENTGTRMQARLGLSGSRTVECVAVHGSRYREGIAIDGQLVSRDAPPPRERLVRHLRRRLQRLPDDDVLGVATMLTLWSERVQGNPAPELAGPADAWASVVVVEACLQSAASGGARTDVRAAPTGFRPSVAR